MASVSNLGQNPEMHYGRNSKTKTARTATAQRLLLIRANTKLYQ